MTTSCDDRIMVSQAFDKMVQLGTALGVKSICDYEDAWIQKVDDEWTFAINGHDDPVTVTPEGMMSSTIRPFDTTVWRNGWIAASLSPREGVFLNGSEDDFIAALNVRLEQIKGEQSQ